MMFKIRFKKPPTEVGGSRIIIGPLKIWSRLHGNLEPIRGHCVASWHWEDSITWSWGLYWYWPTLKTPFGRFSYQSQKPMRGTL